MVRRDAIHQARLLANRLRRLDSRRRNQRDAADLAFRTDLRAILESTPSWLRELVRSALRVDQDNAYVSRELDLAEQGQPEMLDGSKPPPLQLEVSGAGPPSSTIVVRSQEELDALMGTHSVAFPKPGEPLPPLPRMPRPRTRMRPLSAREEVDAANAADMAALEARENAEEAKPLTAEQARELGLDEPATVTEADLRAAFERGERDRRIVAGDPVPPDGNAEWGMPAATALDAAAEYERLVAEAEQKYVEELKAAPQSGGVTDIHGNHYPELRYPNAGEPARVLADGVTVVFDESTAALL